MIQYKTNTEAILPYWRKLNTHCHHIHLTNQTTYQILNNNTKTILSTSPSNHPINPIPHTTSPTTPSNNPPTNPPNPQTKATTLPNPTDNTNPQHPHPATTSCNPSKRKSLSTWNMNKISIYTSSYSHRLLMNCIVPRPKRLKNDSMNRFIFLIGNWMGRN